MYEKLLSYLQKPGAFSSVHFAMNKNDMEIIILTDTYDKAGTGFGDDFLVRSLSLVSTK